MRLQRNPEAWLQLPCLLVFASIIAAHDLQESLAVTLPPGQYVPSPDSG